MDKTTGLPGIQILGHGMEGGRRGEEGRREERRGEEGRRKGRRAEGMEEWSDGERRAWELGMVERRGSGGRGAEETRRRRAANDGRSSYNNDEEGNLRCCLG